MARSINEILNRACDYPYSFPRNSFLFDATTPNNLGTFDTSQTQGRTPVLAFGSNQSPLRLQQKFGHDAQHVIPVERVILHNFDVTYSAHITTYGAVPAMLQYCKGACVDIAVTWLDDRQLDIMHKSEISVANYHFAALDDITLDHQDGATSDIAYVYVSTRGQLTIEGRGISLSAINCNGRQGPVMTTKEALKFIHTQSNTSLTFEEFILKLIRDASFRHSITENLSKAALPFDYDYRIIR